MGTWVFVFSVTLFITCSLALSPDGEALLEMKKTLNDSRSSLRSWNALDTSPCKWAGITCHPQDQRVLSINLPYMQLGGIISPSIGKLSRLQRLALHQNSLHGIIPSEITNCKELRAVYLRANYLQGSIPAELGNLSFLTILDLSSNSLKGSIPPSIGNLTRLRFLNLSTNFFSGEIPTLGILGSFGNKSMCVSIAKHLARGPTKRSSHYFNGFLIGALSTMGVALVALLGFLWICFISKKERAAKKYREVKKQVDSDASTKLVTFHGDLPYSSWEIIEKLETLNEEDVVGSGGFGTVYRMVMNDCSTFAVKRIDRSREGSDQIFERELEILGSIKHINLVNLRGYCRLPSAKLLIYDYVAMGSLDDLLHENGKEQPLKWNARLRIALGSARGLAYLHHDCCPRIVHRDIKSSNILLDENLEPRVSDFGLAKLLVDEDAHVTTVVAGTFGYLAPEYLQSGQANEKSDVYSFGVLLLELVTGKRPTDPTFVKRGLNVVGWINTLEGENLLEDIVDRRCNDATIETVEAIIDIAARCTDANPDERPSMSWVLQMLEEVMSPCPSEFYESHSDQS
ncbi:hypothetical protein IFM89_005404 [Coptis chinensis]|uniref:Protein kinase domain-containing protein n=1 Tax=Coptis chinensis TaxID=261450 RepID=A0A835IUU4_9MAGN|nr:hypothetical protein IFM89_005404 [Coptis chinensis]